MAAKLKVGDEIWIPCEVKPGPFSDERMVRVRMEEGEWLGFVDVRFLRKPVPSEGDSAVLGKVEKVSAAGFLARLPGHSTTGQVFSGSLSKVRPSGSLQA